MRQTKKKTYYEWSDYEKDIKALARRIRARAKQSKNIYGMPRSGLVLAVSLSHLLGKPIIFDVQRVSARTIVVDDIVDTGNTLRRFLQKIQSKPFLCSLYYNTKSEIRPAVYIRKKIKWVVFPWETASSSKYDYTT